LVCGGKLF